MSKNRSLKKPSIPTPSLGPFWEILNKSPVEACESHKWLDIANGLRGLPVEDCADFLWIHLNSFRRNYQTQVFYFFLMEFAFVYIYRDTVHFPEAYAEPCVLVRHVDFRPRYRWGYHPNMRCKYSRTESFIKLWNVPGALQSPNGITRYSNCLYLVLNAVNYSCLSLMRTYSIESMDNIQLGEDFCFG